jgi:hypothetical protein
MLVTIPVVVTLHTLLFPVSAIYRVFDESIQIFHGEENCAASPIPSA